jgi:hypothetical protein
MKKVKLKAPKLEPEPRRGDLSVREMVSIIGGLIGSLCENAPPAKVRDAVIWWAATDAVWASFDGQISSKIQRAMAERGSKMRASGLSDLVASLAAENTLPPADDSDDGEGTS